MRLFLVSVILFSSLVSAFQCEMWYEDNNRGKKGFFPSDAREKFFSPETWKESRKKMKVYLIRINTIYKKKNGLNDYFLKYKMLKVLKSSNIKLALDVQGATLSGVNERRRRLFQKEFKVIKKLVKMGFDIDSINYQSALSKNPRKTRVRNYGYKFDYPMESRIEDIVYYSEAVHQQFPDIKFGIIDALPTKGLEYKKPYAMLQKKMREHGLRLNHIILDMSYHVAETHWRGASWQKVKEVENYVKNQLHIKFGKTFDDRKGGNRSNKVFYTNVMRMADRYGAVGGNPDICALMAWFPYPDKTIPELENYTMMNTFLELSKKLNK